MNYRFLTIAAITCAAAGGAYLFQKDYLSGLIFFTISVIAAIFAKKNKK